VAAGRGLRVIDRFVFASARAGIGEEPTMSGADVVVAGHAGIPFIERVGRQVWFNPGVVGMPSNDGTLDGWHGSTAGMEW
jgi:predicted phosphodiesterase